MERKERMSRREFLQVSAFAVGAASLSSCATVAPAPESAESEAPSPAKPVSIVYWYWADTPELVKFFSGAVESFNNGQDAIDIEAEAQPAALPTREKIVTAHAAGAGGPDVSYTNTVSTLEFFQAGISRPIQEYFADWTDKDDYLPKIVDSNRWVEGERPLLLLPWGAEIGMHHYRPDIYAEAGLEPPQFFDELIENAKALNNPPDLYGFGLRAADGTGFFYNVMCYMASFGLDWVTPEGGTDFDSPEAVEVAQTIAQLYWDGIAQPSALQDRFPQMVALLQAGKIAGWTAGNLHGSMIDPVGTMREQGQYDNVPVPIARPDQQVGDPWTIAHSTGNVMLAATQAPDAAWEFMVHLSQPEVALEFGKWFAMMPARKSVADNQYYKEDPLALAALSVEDRWRLPPYWHKNWVEINYAPTKAWQQVLLKEKTVKEALTVLADNFREV